MANFGVYPSKEELEKAINFIEENFGDEKQPIQTDSNVDKGHPAQVGNFTK